MIRSYFVNLFFDLMAAVMTFEDLARHLVSAVDYRVMSVKLKKIKLFKKSGIFFHTKPK